VSDLGANARHSSATNEHYTPIEIIEAARNDGRDRSRPRNDDEREREARKGGGVLHEEGRRISPGEFVKGESPTHSNVIVYLPPALAAEEGRDRFAQAFGKFGRVAR